MFDSVHEPAATSEIVASHPRWPRKDGCDGGSDPAGHLVVRPSGLGSCGVRAPSAREHITGSDDRVHVWSRRQNGLLAAEKRTGYEASIDDAAGAGGCAGNPGDDQPQDHEARRLTAVRNSLSETASTLRGLGTSIPTRDAARFLSVEELDGCLNELRQVQRAVASVRSRLVSCAAAAKASDAAGMTGTDAYLRDRLGISAREAKKEAELASGLARMPAAADALANGRLGAEQAAALSRAARQGTLGTPAEVEGQLLGDAEASSAERLREKIRRAEQAADEDALRRGENRAYARRRASCQRRDDGMWQFHALLDPVGGEEVATAIRAYTAPDPTGTPISERRTPEQRTADGLTAMAAAGLSAGAPVAGGIRPHVTVIVPPNESHGATRNSGRNHDRASQRRPPGGATGARGSAHAQDSTHARGSTRARASAHPPAGRPTPADAQSATHVRGRSATTGNGATISPEAAARLICDARVTRIVMDASSQVLDVGRATRTWTAAQRAAIVARDRHCRGPGCDRPADWCQIHHVRWWSEGGTTDLDNAILLCSRHHRLVHEGQWSLTLDPATGLATFAGPRAVRTTTAPRDGPAP